MRFLGGPKAASARLNLTHPDRMAIWREAKRLRERKPKGQRGRCVKKRPNFACDLLCYNRRYLERAKQSYELLKDPNADGLFMLRHSRIHGIGVIYGCPLFERHGAYGIQWRGCHHVRSGRSRSTISGSGT